jgi:hypothetical protein
MQAGEGGLGILVLDSKAQKWRKARGPLTAPLFFLIFCGESTNSHFLPLKSNIHVCLSRCSSEPDDQCVPGK